MRLRDHCRQRPPHVSRAQIPRAGRYLPGLVNAVAEMGLGRLWRSSRSAIRAAASRSRPVAAVIAIAERQNVTKVATVYRKHFSIVRPKQ
jgi:hypothetical protein